MSRERGAPAPSTSRTAPTSQDSRDEKQALLQGHLSGETVFFAEGHFHEYALASLVDTAQVSVQARTPPTPG
jgi:hypothetical protein